MAEMQDLDSNEIGEIEAVQQQAAVQQQEVAPVAQEPEVPPLPVDSPVFQLLGAS